MKETIRAFIGLSLEPDIREHIGSVINRLKKTNAAVKWVKAEKAHITLKFLGPVDSEKIGLVQEIIRDTARETPLFSIRLTQPGVFPSEKHPKILWLGFDDPDGVCGRMAALLDAESVKLGFPSEDRNFTGHITLGRVKNPQDFSLLRPLFSSLPAPRLKQTVNAVHLYKSTLTSAGAVYEILETFSFASDAR